MGDQRCREGRNDERVGLYAKDYGTIEDCGGVKEHLPEQVALPLLCHIYGKSQGQPIPGAKASSPKHDAAMAQQRPYPRPFRRPSQPLTGGGYVGKIGPLLRDLAGFGSGDDESLDFSPSFNSCGGPGCGLWWWRGEDRDPDTHADPVANCDGDAGADAYSPWHRSDPDSVANCDGDAEANAYSPWHRSDPDPVAKPLRYLVPGPPRRGGLGR